jgi:hypothetical protein
MARAIAQFIGRNRRFDDGTPVTDSGSTVRYRASTQVMCQHSRNVSPVVVIGSSPSDAAARLNATLLRMRGTDEIADSRHIGQVR